MKRIFLSNGKEVLVDNQDYRYLMQWTWHECKSGSRKKTYARRNRRMVNYVYERGTCRMHRIIAQRMGLLDCRIDHKDENGLNNQRRNLRPATNSRNLANRGPQVNNKSGYKGVCRDKERGKWLAQLTYLKRKILFQRFVYKIEAARAYNKAALKYFGEFAVLNPV